MVEGATGYTVTTTISGSVSASEPDSPHDEELLPLPLSLSYVCQPSNECLQETQVFNRSYEICCEGFTARRRPASHYNPYSARAHYNYYAPLSNTPEGCPIGDHTQFISHSQQTVCVCVLCCCYSCGRLSPGVPEDPWIDRVHSIHRELCLL